MLPLLLMFNVTPSVKENNIFENEVIKKRYLHQCLLKNVQRAKIRSVFQYIMLSGTDFTLSMCMIMDRKCATCEAGTDIL
jgi:hypothetical protein